MASHKNASRLLGAAFLIVVLTSLAAGILLGAATGSGDLSGMLVDITANPGLTRFAVLSGMLNSTGIVALAVLLYVVLGKQDGIMSKVAAGLWLAEAILFAVMQMGLLAMIPLGQDFVAAGAPASSFYLTLGEFLYDTVYSQGMVLHMWFYCAGGLLWYYLFYRSNYIPRAIPLFGLLAVTLGFAGVVFQLLGYEVPIWAFLPILPFELAIGAWLLLRGIAEPPAAASPVRRAVAGE